MATSRWASFVTRLNRDSTSRAIRMDGLNELNRGPMTLLSFNRREDLNKYALGVDRDIGGTSSAHLDFVPSSSDANINNKNDAEPLGTVKFWGDMRLAVRNDLRGRIRGGYAGFRSKNRPTLFSELTDDISNHAYLALRVRVGGHPRTHNAYYVNLQTDTPISGELWQHRLYFRKADGSWEDIFIPFSAFALTSYGELATGRASQVNLEDEKIRWIGISLLGGNAGIEGPFELGIDSIKAVNKEDVHTPPIVDKPSSHTVDTEEELPEEPWRQDRI
ncbi:complex I intermediate-associated CIA30 [Pyrrhoderma noxium]|uniref:Complex I intermediate-associated CIA30 n=1 Tax=Pyrrhoderma noxium TaxID=2282107 RepID=A0A286U939_9AGAM|nr:complex I intermediate-associated CIA30 [Pyrrhoderma noxium]